MDRHVGPGSRRHRWRAVVRRNLLPRVVVRGIRVLRLSRYRPYMSTPRGSLFLRRSARVDPAVAAVIANAAGGLIHPGVVHVMNGPRVHAIHRRVVEKVPVLPAAAFVAMAEVPETIIDAAVKPHFRAPVALIEKESSAAPGPISRSP